MSETKPAVVLQVCAEILKKFREYRYCDICISRSKCNTEIRLSLSIGISLGYFCGNGMKLSHNTNTETQQNE